MQDFALFAGTVLLLSTARVWVVITRSRRAVIGGLGRPQHQCAGVFPISSDSSLPGPARHSTVTRAVREWHRNRPSTLGRRLWAALLIICWSIVAWGTFELITV